MPTYNLQPNEGVILKSKSVSHGFWGAYTDEIMLTNLHFVWTSIGIMGFPKNAHTYPLHQIKVFDGKAQVLLGEHGGNGFPMLDVHFNNGQTESFGFQIRAKDAKKEIMKWIAALNKAITGESIADEIESEFSESKALPGAEMIASTIGDTVDILKNALGFKQKNITTTTTLTKLAGKCSFCGASISGTKGQIVRCKYCDGDQHI